LPDPVGRALRTRGRRELFTTTFCESHASQIPLHAVARLLGAATGVEGLDAQAARARIRAESSDAEAEDLPLFDDLLGIDGPDAVLPRIDSDARRRRLTALVNAATLARKTPAVYVVEDAHWIDEVSESVLADFLRRPAVSRSPATADWVGAAVTTKVNHVGVTVPLVYFSKVNCAISI